jgi:hypothetical protein
LRFKVRRKVMKYLIGIFVLSACGVWAANVDNTAVSYATDTNTENSTEEKNSDENLARINRRESRPTYNRPAYTGVAPAIADEPVVDRSPIPALILPNNVCVINTDLSPDRSIEDHILACIRAQEIRQSIR